MGVHNINLLQQNIDLEELRNVNDRYILDSLANMGQRIGVKGAGVNSHTLYLKDIGLFDESQNEEYLVLHYDKANTRTKNSNIIKAWVCTRNALNNIHLINSKIVGAKEIIDINNIIKGLDIDKYSANNSFSFLETVVNDLFEWQTYNDITNYISTISNVSITYNTLTLSLFGRTYLDNSAIYEKIIFDLANNVINTYYKVQLMYVDNNKSYYLLTVLKIKDKSSYNLELYVFNYTNSEFLNYEVLNNYNNQLNNDLIHIDKKLSEEYDEFIDVVCNMSLTKKTMKYTTYTNDFVIVLLDKLGTDVSEESQNTITIDFNTTKNLLMSVNNDKHKYIINNLLTNLDINIDNIINYINNNISYLIPNIIKYCSDYLYTHTINRLFSRILCNIYEYIENNQITIDTYNNYYYNLYNKGYLVLHKDLRLTYLCEDTNIFKLYDSNDFNVEFCSTETMPKGKLNDITYIYDTNVLIKYHKFVNMKLFGQYNNLFGNLININIKSFANPFIGTDNLWYCNNVNTGIPASAINTKNIKFIIFETDNASMYKLDAILLSNPEKVYNSYKELEQYGIYFKEALKTNYNTIEINKIVIEDKLYQYNLDNKSENTVGAIVQDAKLPRIYITSNNDLSNTILILKHKINTNIDEQNSYYLYILYDINSTNSENQYLEPITLRNTNHLVTIQDIFNMPIHKDIDYKTLETAFFNHLPIALKLLPFYSANDLEHFITLYYNYNDNKKVNNDMILSYNKNDEESVDKMPNLTTSSDYEFNINIEAEVKKLSNALNYNEHNVNIVTSGNNNISSEDYNNTNSIINLNELEYNVLQTPNIMVPNMLYKESKFLNKLGILSFTLNYKYLDYLGQNRAGGFENELLLTPLTYLKEYTFDSNSSDVYSTHDILRCNYEIINEKKPFNVDSKKYSDTSKVKTVFETQSYQEFAQGQILYTNHINYNTISDFNDYIFISKYNIVNFEENSWADIKLSIYLNLNYIIRSFTHYNNLNTFFENVDNKIVINGYEWIQSEDNSIAYNFLDEKLSSQLYLIIDNASISYDIVNRNQKANQLVFKESKYNINITDLEAEFTKRIGRNSDYSVIINNNNIQDISTYTSSSIHITVQRNVETVNMENGSKNTKYMIFINI